LPVPDLNGCGRFKGDEAVSRWLARLLSEFQRVGYTENNLPHSRIIQAIDMLSEGEAASYLDNNFQAQAVIERARVNISIQADRQALETALRDRFITQF
ncbi:uncharacterized protein BCR38DRAFT_353748, partial [Pseudomassariella vexata]